MSSIVVTFSCGHGHEFQGPYVNFAGHDVPLKHGALRCPYCNKRRFIRAIYINTFGGKGDG